MTDDNGLGVYLQNKCFENTFQFDPLADIDGEKDLTGGLSSLLRYFLNRLRAGGRPANIHLPLVPTPSPNCFSQSAPVFSGSR